MINLELPGLRRSQWLFNMHGHIRIQENECVCMRSEQELLVRKKTRNWLAKKSRCSSPLRVCTSNTQPHMMHVNLLCSNAPARNVCECHYNDDDYIGVHV